MRDSVLTSLVDEVCTSEEVVVVMVAWFASPSRVCEATTASPAKYRCYNSVLLNNAKSRIGAINPFHQQMLKNKNALLLIGMCKRDPWAFADSRSLEFVPKEVYAKNVKTQVKKPFNTPFWVVRS